MYVNAQGAMSRRSAFVNPTGAIAVMQHPGLTRLGRLTGSPLVTMGQVAPDPSLDPSLSSSAVSTSGLFGMSWTSILLIGGVLLGGAFLLKRFGGGGGIGGAPAPRRRRSSFKLPKVSLPTVAMLGALAYFYAKSQSTG
jgi:hypothetical protein